VRVTDLARDHGTPLWVVDEADLRERCRRYVEGFPGVGVAYASKAWCTIGILQIVADEGLHVDVVSGGELHTALLAGVDPARIVFHGNNKSDAELERALEVGVGRIVVDSFDELDRLERIAAARDVTAACWLRITPGIDAHTHEYVRTGHDDSKFGFTLSLGLADEAIVRALELPHLEVVGVHAHIGSQIFGTDPFIANAEVTLDLLARWRDEHGIDARRAQPRWRDGDPLHPRGPPGRRGAVRAGRARDRGRTLRRARLPPAGAVRRAGPRHRRAVDLHPLRGRHRQGAPRAHDLGQRRRRHVGQHPPGALRRRARGRDRRPRQRGGPGRSRWSASTASPATSSANTRPCPSDVRVGDLLAVAATGAYTESMASNYNRIPRPAAVLVRDGQVRELLRRETLDDLVRRDVPVR
jgi:diaminopimelate decarboxylase